MATLIGPGPNQVSTNEMLGGMAFQDKDSVKTKGINRVYGVTDVTAATYTMLDTDTDIVVNYAGTCTLTLLAASLHKGRELWIKTITANLVNAATSQVVPLLGGAAGTAILAATAGKWARLVSDGTNWRIMAAA